MNDCSECSWAPNTFCNKAIWKLKSFARRRRLFFRSYRFSRGRRWCGSNPRYLLHLSLDKPGVLQPSDHVDVRGSHS